MSDFNAHDTDWTRPARHWADVTPHDTNNLTHVTRGIYVGTTGNVRLLSDDGLDVVFHNLAAGVIHPLSAVRVFATNTTATDIVAVW